MKQMGTSLYMLQVSAAAKAYAISDRVRALAACPERRTLREPDIIPGKVKKGALLYKGKFE